MNDKMSNEHIQELMKINAGLEHELSQLVYQLTGDEWFELLARDLEAEQLRKQNRLQEHIRHAQQILAERK